MLYSHTLSSTDRYRPALFTAAPLKKCRADSTLEGRGAIEASGGEATISSPRPVAS
jgi:hypothetical protein